MPYFVPVVGVPRSGTSLVAEIVHSLGIPMGKKFTQPPDSSWSPSHFWADAEFNAVHCKLVSGADYPWVLGMKSKHPEAWVEYEDLIKLRETEFDRWGLKDEWLPFLLPSTLSFVKHEVRMIVTRRAWNSSVKSYAVRANLSGEIASDRLLPALKAISQIESQYFNYLIVDFESLIDLPSKEVDRIASFLEVPVMKEAIAKVNPDWKRF